MVLRFFGREIILPPVLKYIIISLIFVSLVVLGFIIVKSENSGELAPIQTTAFNADSGVSDASAIPDLSATGDKDSDSANKSSQSSDQSNPESLSESGDTLFVYIIGEVKQPDVYEIKEGSILKELVSIAGGLTENADSEAVNLAYRLSGGMMIRIPSKGAADKTWIIDSEVSQASASVTADSISSGVKININTATVSELCALPGVGESTALKIISYRTENGPFKDISDVTKVNGIKNAKYSEIKSFITVK